MLQFNKAWYGLNLPILQRNKACCELNLPMLQLNKARCELNLPMLQLSKAWYELNLPMLQLNKAWCELNLPMLQLNKAWYELNLLVLQRNKACFSVKSTAVVSPIRIVTNFELYLSAMALSNLERMIQLATEVFDVKNDPSQLDVDQHVIERMLRLHPASVSEYTDGNGPVAWVLCIPTTIGLMNRFLACEITEKELFDLTPEDVAYDALYLCSALVLPEYRQQGITKTLAATAIEKIRARHSLKALFIWPFSHEGIMASESIARQANLPLYKRNEE